MMAAPRPPRRRPCWSSHERCWLGCMACPAEKFERPSVRTAWTVRQLAGNLVLVHAGLAQSLGQPTTEVALPIHEFVTRYRRDVEMIMAATLEASVGLTGPEVIARLESAIDDLATRFDAGLEMSRVIRLRDVVRPRSRDASHRIVELVIHSDDLQSLAFPR